MTEASTTPVGLVRRILVRFLVVLTVVAVVIGVRFVITGEISPAGARLLLLGIGLGLFGALGFGADAAGRRVSSVWGRLGPVAAVVGGALVVVAVAFDTWQFAWWWQAFGVAFAMAFAGLRGSLIRAVDVEGAAALARAFALLAVQLSLGLSVWSCIAPLPTAGWKLFSISVLVEAGAVVAMLALRALRPSSPPSSGASSSSSSSSSQSEQKEHADP